MNFFRTFIKWQFWLSLVLMAVALFGFYHFVFRVWIPAYTNHNQAIEIPDLATMDINQAMKTLDDLKLTYEIDSLKFDSARAPLSVLDFYPEAGFRVKEGRKIFIKSNPKGWRPTTLPDIVGKSKRLAFTQLTLAGLSVGDTIYEPDIAKDAVLRVMFKGRQIGNGDELPRFSKVDLVLGKGLEFGVKTPNLIGLGLEEARAAIFANRFEVGVLNIAEAVGDSAILKVFYQYPLPDDNYDQGLPVDLWLSAKDPKELSGQIKDLNFQYRNFGENDSINAAKYAEDLKLNEKGHKVKELEEIDATEVGPKEQPKGLSFDDDE